jgi:hypothetical protein
MKGQRTSRVQVITSRSRPSRQLRRVSFPNPFPSRTHIRADEADD